MRYQTDVPQFIVNWDGQEWVNLVKTIVIIVGLVTEPAGKSSVSSPSLTLATYFARTRLSVPGAGCVDVVTVRHPSMPTATARCVLPTPGSPKKMKFLP